MPNPRPTSISRRRFLARAGYLGFGLVAWAACGGSKDERVQTTLDRAIVQDIEGNLAYGEGEPHVVRTELAQAQTGRDERRRSLVVFHHVSDFRILDEESPLRSEWSDACEPPLSTTAFRPHEALSVQSAEALIAAANALRQSPVTGQPVDFVVHTGNATDNAQFNELRWFLDLMDGVPVYPDSGAIGYQGVQAESPAPAYGDLLQLSQRPFTPVGLAYPWYAVVGNRDVLAQGNFPPSERAQQFVTGAQKVVALGPDALAEACSGADALLGPDSSATIFNDPDTIIRGVGSDANRRLLSRQEWLAEHFAGAEIPGPQGHGFAPESVAAGAGNYILDRGAVAFIVLDTVNAGGFAAGSIGEEQILWLEAQLIARSASFINVAGETIATQNPDRLVVLVSHHPVESMTNPFPNPADETRYRGETLETLLHRFPNVVLHIAGHTLQQRITAHPDPEGSNRAYWQITTGSPLNLPMQGRLIDIVDNGDGTLSVFSTVYDSAAPLNPGDADDPTPDDGINQRLLAGVARQLAVADPQADIEALGLPSDRNAEMLLAAPFDLATLPTPTQQARPRDV